MQKIAIVSGSTGQDGQCIIPQLIERNIKVFALVRRRSDFPNLGSLEAYKGTPNFEIFEGDVTDLASMIKLCKAAKADYFYHLAAQSHVGTSFDQKALTTNTIALGTLNCLEAIRESGIHTRFYNAATSELFGGLVDTPRNEDSPFHPRSPYGVAKLYAYWITINFRETYKMFASNGILFNHECYFRGPNFVTRKITRAIAAIKYNYQSRLLLGNLDAKRDWGWAPDFTRGMQMILEHKEPGDFVLATGETHSVREFCQIGFEHAGLGDYQKYVVVDPNLYRPAEVNVLIGDYSYAERTLGWKPTVRFEELVRRMVDFDLENYKLE